MNINEQTLQYISAHASDDVTHLALHPSKDPQVEMSVALQQIAGRQKAKEKLPEWYATEGVLYPKKVSLEQCSSSQTAEYKASLVEGDSFADFSGGFGVDTVALARKFDKGWYVEPQEELCELFQHNCKVLDINNVNIVNGTMEDNLAAIGPVDTIYLDPSRRDVHGRKVVALEDCVPNLLEWKEPLLAKCNTLMVKLSPMIDIFQTLRDLPDDKTQKSIKRLSVAILIIGGLALFYTYVKMVSQLFLNNFITPMTWNPEIRGWQIFILATYYVGVTLLFVLCCIFLYRTNRGLKNGEIFPKSNIPVIRWAALAVALYAFANCNYEEVVKGESVLMVDSSTILFPLIVLLFAGLYKMAHLAAEDSNLAI